MQPAKSRIRQYHHVFSNKLRPDLLQTTVEWSKERGVYLSRIASTIKRKSITFSKIGELAETNSEYVTTGEMRRIIMRDGFHYFAVTE